jgi:hypothetical protein
MNILLIDNFEERELHRIHGQCPNDLVPQPKASLGLEKPRYDWKRI